MKRVTALSISLLLVTGMVFGQTKAMAGIALEDCFRRCHFVLVGGLNNELFPSYFENFEQFVSQYDSKNVSIVQPSSLNSVEENLPIIRRQLLEIHNRDLQPLVVVAHSKGGIEIVNVLGKYADDFSPEVVAKAIIVNSPLTGSPYMKEAILSFKSDWGMGGLNFHPVYLNSLKVMSSLETNEIKMTLESSYGELSRESLLSLSERIFYLRSSEEESRVSSILRKSARYLKKYGSRNDGLIPVESQMLYEFMGLRYFGTDLGVLEGVDHLDLFVNDRQLDQSRDEIFRSVFHKVFSTSPWISSKCGAALSNTSD